MNLAFVAAKVDAGLGDRDPVSLFIVPLDTPGVSRSRPVEMMLKSAGGIAELFFDNARIPAESLLGHVEGRGLADAFSTLGLARVASAARAVAASELALTLDFVKQRSAFGQKIIEFQNTQLKLATVKPRSRWDARSSMACLLGSSTAPPIPSTRRWASSGAPRWRAA